MRSSVDLPEPEGPTTATISVSRTVKNTSRNARVPSGNVFPTPWNDNAVPAGAGSGDDTCLFVRLFVCFILISGPVVRKCG